MSAISFKSACEIGALLDTSMFFSFHCYISSVSLFSTFRVNYSREAQLNIQNHWLKRKSFNQTEEKLLSWCCLFYFLFAFHAIRDYNNCWRRIATRSKKETVSTQQTDVTVALLYQLPYLRTSPHLMNTITVFIPNPVLKFCCLSGSSEIS